MNQKIWRMRNEISLRSKLYINKCLQITAIIIFDIFLDNYFAISIPSPFLNVRP